jgi:hypothetical protein
VGGWLVIFDYSVVGVVWILFRWQWRGEAVVEDSLVGVV